MGPNLPSIEFHYGDCLSVMANMPDKSVDLVLSDLPYGKTACTWDSRIPLEPLWKEFRRICKGAVVLTATQPFTSVLVTSNIKQYTDEWVWSKGKGSNPLTANKKPMRSHESVLVFGKPLVYHPQMTEGKPYTIPRTGGNRTNSIIGKVGDRPGFVQATRDTSKRFPLTVLNFSIHCGSKLHPAQKPVELMEYMIRTYTDEGMTVLDCAMGSGTTGVACANTNRNFIGIENDEKYFNMSVQRISAALDLHSVRSTTELV